MSLSQTKTHATRLFGYSDSRERIQAEDDEKERTLSKAYFEKRYHRKEIR